MSPDLERPAERHLKFTTLRSRKKPLCFVVVSLLLTFLNWIALGKPLPISSAPFTWFFGHLVALLLLAKLLVAYRAIRERLVIAFGVLWLGIGAVQTLVPNRLAAATASIRQFALLLSFAAAALSVTMLIWPPGRTASGRSGGVPSNPR